MAGKAAAEPQVMVALTSFVGLDSIIVSKGDLYAPDHPAVKKWPAFFGPVIVRRSAAEPRIEQATAAPGEKRGA